nr:DALR anticodon-binding domain-containing protein [Legionella norrlandica]
MPEAASLSAACKRVGNILTQAGNSNKTIEINEKLIEEGAERALFEHINKITKTVETLYIAADYGALLKLLAGLKEPVDAFFDHVMVMVEDELLKRNRLALLQRLQELLQGVADISLL